MADCGTTFWDIVSASCNNLLLVPLTACCRIRHVYLSTGTCWQGLRIIFGQGRPTLQHQHHRSTSAAFQRDLQLAAPSRRQRRGKWRQRCVM